MSQAHAVDPTRNELLAELEKKFGPNNFFRTMANAPKAMAGFVDLYKALMGPTALDRRIKEMVYLAVSTVNECPYCTMHHTKTAKAAGISDAEIHALASENNHDFTEREQVALHYARELTRTASVPRTIRHQAEELFPYEQLVELNMIVALANFTNRFNNGLAVQLES